MVLPRTDPFYIQIFSAELGPLGGSLSWLSKIKAPFFIAELNEYKSKCPYTFVWNKSFFAWDFSSKFQIFLGFSFINLITFTKTFFPKEPDPANRYRQSSVGTKIGWILKNHLPIPIFSNSNTKYRPVPDFLVPLSRWTLNTRIPTVKLKIPGKAFLRTSVTFKL